MTLSNQELAHAANDVRNEGSDVAAAIVDDLVLRIDEPPPFVGLKELLDALRSNRCFAALGRLADAVIASGASYAYVRHQHAQALIEQGHLTMAKLVLNDLLRDIDTGAPLADVENGKKRLESRSEAVGLLARTSKQQFVRLAHNREEAQTHLERAIAYYGEVYPLDRAWHGANLVALRRRAEQEGWKLSGPSARETAERLLNDLLRLGKESWNPWQFAGAGEACLAFGGERSAECTEYYAKFAELTDGFGLAAAGRQLREIWRFDPNDESPGPSIRSGLDARALRTDKGGEIHYGASELSALGKSLASGAGDPVQEAILGENRQITIQTILSLLERARSVCQVVDHGLYAQQRASGGSGFLIDGGSYRPSYTGQALLVTNHHVLNKVGGPSHPGGPVAVRTDRADAIFHFDGGGPQRTFKVGEVIGTDTCRDLTVATLREPPPAKLGLSLERDKNTFPQANAGARSKVFLIGHPNGRGLEFSLSDNEVVDHDLGQSQSRGFHVIHYKAPTEAGMSGSPVFEQNSLGVVGVHRLGNAKPIRMRPDAPNPYRANEAIWIDSVFVPDMH